MQRNEQRDVKFREYFLSYENSLGKKNIKTLILVHGFINMETLKTKKIEKRT